jgi:hypothetical protein
LLSRLNAFEYHVNKAPEQHHDQAGKQQVNRPKKNPAGQKEQGRNDKQDDRQEGQNGIEHGVAFEISTGAFDTIKHIGHEKAGQSLQGMRSKLLIQQRYLSLRWKA